MITYGTSSAACTAKITVPTWLVSQRSRNSCTGVMKPCRLPSAQTRVPTRNSMSGITSAAGEAISPNVTIPLAKAWPEEPRIENAVMLVPKSDIRNTNGPSVRLARK